MIGIKSTHPKYKEVTKELENLRKGIKIVREQKGMTIEQIASGFDLSEKEIEMIEDIEKHPHYDTSIMVWLLLAEALGTSLEELNETGQKA